MSDSQPYKVLVVDDEKDILELLQYNLEKEGYLVKTATDGIQALSKAKEFLPHLIILDVMLPGLDGIETARQIREIPALKESYVLMLTARGEEYAQVAAFGIGADEYLTKPIKPKALMSRLQAILSRSTRRIITQKPLIIGELIIDKIRFTVTHKGKVLILPKKEFNLLFFLAFHPDRIFTREELLQAIWEQDVFVLERTVDVHIRKIREKIGEDYIKTIKGVGYLFELPQSS
jgi:two-component system alkaline phosphatase synthesis response regulator PhoP